MMMMIQSLISFEAREIKIMGKNEHKFYIKVLQKIVNSKISRRKANFSHIVPMFEGKINPLLLKIKINFSTILLRETRALRKSKKIVM